MFLLQLIVRWCLHSFTPGFFGEGAGYLFLLEIAMKKILTSFAISLLSQNSFNISVITVNSDLTLYFFNTAVPHMFLCILGGFFFSSLLSWKNCSDLIVSSFFFYYYEFSLDFMHPIEEHFFLSFYAYLLCQYSVVFLYLHISRSGIHLQLAFLSRDLA